MDSARRLGKTSFGKLKNGRPACVSVRPQPCPRSSRRGGSVLPVARADEGALRVVEAAQSAVPPAAPGDPGDRRELGVVHGEEGGLHAARVVVDRRDRELGVAGRRHELGKGLVLVHRDLVLGPVSLSSMRRDLPAPRLESQSKKSAFVKRWWVLEI